MKEFPFKHGDEFFKVDEVGYVPATHDLCRS